MRFPSLLLVACVAAASMSCGVSSIEPEPPAVGNVEVAVARPSLMVKNATDGAVSYFAYEEQTLTLATFPAPCGDQTRKLDAGASTSLPYSAITGYREGATTAVLFWCTVRRNADGSWRTVGTMQNVRVRL
jgi:hypothetical protein